MADAGHGADLKGIGRKVLVVNKCPDGKIPAGVADLASQLGLPEAIALPYSAELASMVAEGSAILTAEPNGLPSVEDLLSAGGVIP